MEWSPEYYSPDMQGQTPQFMHAIKEVPKLELQGNELVLDVGCGDGKISSIIAHKWLPKGSIHGIDNSSYMIEEAKSIRETPNATFEFVSLFDYEPTKLYDVVVCFWVLYLFEDYHKALEKLSSFLKPNGKVLVCHVIDPGTPFFQVFQKHIAPQKMPVTLPTIETIMAAIRKVGTDMQYLEIKKNYDTYRNLKSSIEAMKKIPFF